MGVMVSSLSWVALRVLSFRFRVLSLRFRGLSPGFRQGVELVEVLVPLKVSVLLKGRV